ncbi:formaldehyde-activating enzyme [Candidatus Venteria ishoeyi]|uniref:Formaldehyde-activating enzyme n=1 Tax=Candidatus Venteria ishoeyi TaxID=1899563 RepID=A0A1H6FCX6_9GAMM|nr:formaldehyde-activating enzyme [Candidatus Venteria ishoeyi]MDM8545306.1 formaldehyde-activating enzyme [Candidatus Venteria ishoeyi]SEH07928.1 Formaldehyde-activating enzyme [Candidatus Venteria ishoeyi]
MAIGEQVQMRVGQSWMHDEFLNISAETEILIGEISGPVGKSFAQLFGSQLDGQYCVLAKLNKKIQVRPNTLVINKADIDDQRHQELFRTVIQTAVAHGVLDCVRNSEIPKKKANDLVIIANIWLDPEVCEREGLDEKQIFTLYRDNAAKAVHKALCYEPSVDWLLEKQDNLLHQ